MRLSAKWLAMTVVPTALLVCSVASDEAQACWNCCFGSCGYGARSYRPVYYYGSYGPSISSCGAAGCGTIGWRRCSPCATSCSPCGSGCSVYGGPACGTCNSSDCAAGSGSNSLTPAPDAPPPNANWEKKNRTYADPPPPPPADDVETGSVKIGPRTDVKSGSDDSEKSGQLNDEDENGIESFKKPAASTDRDGDLDDESDRSGSTSKKGTKGTPSPGASKRSKKGPVAPKADDEPEGDSTGLAIMTAEKVAWRSAPARQRIEVRTPPEALRLVRLPAYPKSSWLPADGDSKLAKK